MSSMDTSERDGGREQIEVSGSSGGEPVRQPKPRGFAAMTPEKQRAIAQSGGRAAHEKGRAHEFTKDEARVAGKKGGDSVSRDRSHMANIGRRGGVSVSKDREHMIAIGRKGGVAVSADRDHMVEIGRKGGVARKAPRS